MITRRSLWATIAAGLALLRSAPDPRSDLGGPLPRPFDMSGVKWKFFRRRAA
jgi:hypothetical protein